MVVGRSENWEDCFTQVEKSRAAGRVDRK